MPRTAHISVLLLLPFIAACNPVLEIESQGYTQTATQCIKREAQAVAPQRVDLRRAATAVVKRCKTELHSKERALIASYPKFEDKIREEWKNVTAMRYRQALRAVARARTG